MIKKLAKDQNIIISVVMPIFNASKYLKRTLNSLNRQNFKSFEVICVDDGSTDNSADIVDYFSRRYSKFKLLKQNNKFAGMARNYGMSFAKGEYIIFLDSDDVFNRNMLSTLYKAMKRHNVDIVIFNYKNFSHFYYKHKYKIKYSGREIDKESIVDDLFDFDSGVPWNKFYRMEFLKKYGLQFQGIPNTNDVYFTRMSLVYSNRIYFCPNYLLNYRSGNSSSLQGNRIRHPDSFYYAYKAIIDDLKRNDLYEKYKKTTQKMIIDTCTSYLLLASSNDLFVMMFNLSKQLFTEAQIDLVDDDAINNQIGRIINSIINDDLFGCLMNAYLYLKKQEAEKTYEYKLSKIIKGFLKKK